MSHFPHEGSMHLGRKRLTQLPVVAVRRASEWLTFHDEGYKGDDGRSQLALVGPQNLVVTRRILMCGCVRGGVRVWVYKECGCVRAGCVRLWRVWV